MTLGCNGHLMVTQWSLVLGLTGPPDNQIFTEFLLLYCGEVRKFKIRARTIEAVDLFSDSNFTLN